MTVLSLHGIHTSGREKAKSVTHVSGTFCHPCPRPLTPQEFDRAFDRWRELYNSARTEERADGAWTRGPHFSPTGLQAASADAQRAAFAIRAVRGLDVGSVTAAAAPEDNVIWARFGSGRSG